MKFLLLLILLLSCNVYPYIIKNYGFKTGITLSDWNVDFYANEVDKEFDILPGFTGGIFIEWLDEPYLSFISELNYIQKGTEYKILTEGATFWGEPDFDYINRLHYLSLPFLVKLKATESKLVPYLLFGFRYDYLISSSIESAEFQTQYDNFQNHNLGAELGLGFNFNLLQKHCLIEYRYSTHFNYLYQTSEEGYFSFTAKFLTS